MRMGDIFSRATSVCIWLGEEASGSDRAMCFIEEVSHLAKLDKLVKDPEALEDWHALALLVRRPWFSRRWVLQEIAFARKATLQCGTIIVRWADFTDAVALFGDRENAIGRLFHSTSQGLQPGTRLALGNIRSSPAHTIVMALNNIVRKAADGHVLDKLCTMEALVSNVALLQTGDPATRYMP